MWRNIWANEAFVEQLDDMLRKRKKRRSDELFYYGRVVLVDALLRVKDGDYFRYRLWWGRHNKKIRE